MPVAILNQGGGMKHHHFGVTLPVVWHRFSCLSRDKGKLSTKIPKVVVVDLVTVWILGAIFNQDGGMKHLHLKIMWEEVSSKFLGSARDSPQLCIKNNAIKQSSL